ncbi:Aminopeptidase 2 mitochondrial, partial [Bonamia ostreae]
LTNKIAQKIEKDAKDEAQKINLSKLKGPILYLRAKSGFKPAIETAKQIFSEIEKNGIDSNIYGAVLKTVIKYGNDDEFEKVKRLFESETEPTKKNTSLSALGSSKDKNIIQKALKMVLSRKVRAQDRFILFLALARNPHAAKQTWQFFKKSYEVLRKEITSDTLFSHFVNVVRYLDAKEEIEDARNFFDGQNQKGYEKKLSQAFEEAELTLATRKRELPAIEKWLNEKY